MKNIARLMALALLLLCGCVFVDKPIGSAAVNLSDQLPQWNGTWIMLQDESQNQVTVTDPTNGILRVSIMAKNAKTNVPEGVVTAYLRSHEGTMFVTWSIQPSGTGTNAPVKLPFMWGRIKRLESVRRAVILLWPPRREDIARLVKNGTLEGGEYDREETQLKNLSTSHLDLLAKDDSATLFQWDEPLIFIREKK